MNTDIKNRHSHVNVGGLVLCKKKQKVRKTDYVFKWRREDLVYTSDPIQKLLRWVKEHVLFIEQWNTVDQEEWDALCEEQDEWDDEWDEPEQTAVR